jgi:outer membrane protein OmpA-like peptidoglycan-associated protein
MMNTIQKTTMMMLVLALSCMTTQAQIGKRLGNAAEKAAERAATRQTEQRVEKAVDKTIDGALDGNKDSKQQQQQSNTPVPAPAPANTPAETPATPQTPQQPTATAPPKLESFTQYDFVPGDQILFFEDFSQDAVGDFPDLWTTNGSGEVRTINIAPGKWLHPTTIDKTFAYMNTIAFPQNFIVEFDYIPAPEEVRYGGYELTLYNEEGRELSTELYPGNQGLRLGFTSQGGWTLLGYKEGFNNSNEGSSEKNPMVNNVVNHVIMWVQNRRVRVYHLGAKVLDLPTVLYPNTTFNRLRFFGWGSYDTPYISNIKVTTAAPDVRSKLLTEGKIISYGINFDSGKDVIKPESYGAIKSIADVLKENPDVRVCVVGHTDSDGAAAANLDLSKRRAAAVKDCLSKEFGIDASRIETDGKGQTEPLAPNNTTEGKAKNRRVEFVKI